LNGLNVFNDWNRRENLNGLNVLNDWNGWNWALELNFELLNRL